MQPADSKPSALSQANAALMWRNGLANTATFELTAAQLEQVLNGARAEALAPVAAPPSRRLGGWLARLLRRPAPIQPKAEVVAFPAPAAEPEPASEPHPVVAAVAEDEMEALRAQIRAIYAEPPAAAPPPVVLAPRAKARRAKAKTSQG